jgi:hypothetical protein
MRLLYTIWKWLNDVLDAMTQDAPYPLVEEEWEFIERRLAARDAPELAESSLAELGLKRTKDGVTHSV